MVFLKMGQNFKVLGKYLNGALRHMGRKRDFVKTFWIQYTLNTNIVCRDSGLDLGVKRSLTILYTYLKPLNIYMRYKSPQQDV